MLNTITKDLGPVSGYAIAVENGYTGTEEEWIAEVLRGTQNAQTATEKAAEAAASERVAAESADDASDSADSAKADALKAEGNAVGRQNDVDVVDGPYYHNNAKYYAEQAEASKRAAASSETAAGTAAAAAQEWATGADDPTAEPGPENNAKYWAGQAAASATAAAGSAASGIAALANEAPTFDATAAYSAGEYVLYDSVLYRFTADHGAGAWTGTDATAVKIGGEIGELKNTISDITGNLPTDYITSGFVATDSLPDKQKLKIRAQITALQAGSGTPSGENIRAISGWDYADLRVTGVNVWGGNDMISDIKSAISDAVVNQAKHTVSFVWNNTALNALFTGFKPSARYTVILTFSNNSIARTNMQVDYSDGTHESIPATVSGSKETTVFVTKANKTVVSISKSGSGGTTTVYAAESGVFEGVKTANDFAAYAGKSYVTDLSSTLYGGVVDYTEGTITVTKGYIASYNGESLPGVWISDRDTYSIGEVPTTGAQVVYDLAEPTVVDITPVDILSVQGINNIWVDCGNVEYYYAISIPEYVEKYNEFVSTHLLYDDFEYGTIDTSGNNYASTRFLRTITYVDDSMGGFNVAAGFKVAVVVYKPTGTVQRVSWIRNARDDGGMNYRFDHTNKYRLYVGYEDERIDLNVVNSIDAVTFYQETLTAAKRYNENYGKVESLKESTGYANNILYGLMADNYKLSYANAPKPLSIYNYLGNDQNVHPKVIYFANGLFGHKYWMAYTPYPFSETSAENPCIAYSEDGFNWTNIPGNPIDTPTTGYNSDTHLVYNSDTGNLECWFRHYVSNPASETIYRMVSSDGITWGSKEALRTSASGDHLLSPAVMYDSTNDKYMIWVVSAENGYHIAYYESATGTDWSYIRSITLSYQYNSHTYNVWHIDVDYIDDKYVIVAMCKYSTTDWDLFIATSSDNATYATPSICIARNPDSWDKKLYRSCIVNTGSENRIYYSAISGSYYHIGISASKTLADFIGKISYS